MNNALVSRALTFLAIVVMVMSFCLVLNESLGKDKPIKFLASIHLDRKKLDVLCIDGYKYLVADIDSNNRPSGGGITQMYEIVHNGKNKVALPMRCE